MYEFGCPTSKNFLRLWVGYWKVQKGKGTLRPTTRLIFLSLRLPENERSLVTLTLGIEEAFPNEVEVISDLNELVFLMNELSRDFDRIFEDSERSTFTAPSSLNDCLSTVARNGLVGRPRLQILQQELQTLTMTPVFVGLISKECLESSAIVFRNLFEEWIRFFAL